MLRPMTRHLLLLLWLLPCLAAVAATPAARPVDIAPEHPAPSPGLRLLGTIALPHQRVDGQLLSGLSALAWDEDEGLLYAVSDRGALFHLRPEFKGSELVRARAVAAWPLLDPQGRPLTQGMTDAEGLVLRGGHNGRRGDSELVISFEHQPRIWRYDNHGRYRGSLRLPPVLRLKGNYQNANAMLEAVTHHPRLGYLTAPERPLRRLPQDRITLFALDGRRWLLPRAPHEGSAVVALEALPDGSLLVLERSFASLLHPIVITLSRVWPTPDCRAERHHPCRHQPLFELSSAQGWLLDNFEGLTRYRGNRFFMVSDDNGFVLQQTLLSQFALPKLDIPPPK